MYSVMWSEHCSYKSSKVHLRYFGETTTEEMRAGMLAGIGENAGVVDIGDGWAVTFKVESHNHPSYVEPYQGAATGVGGIVRDIMAMGARPVAVMDQLRFGAADAPDTRRVLDGVVRGIGGYGNSLGLPNIGGETVFDACYAGNPLVNALCVGVLRQEDLHLAFASGAGAAVLRPKMLPIPVIDQGIEVVGCDKDDVPAFAAITAVRAAELDKLLPAKAHCAAAAVTALQVNLALIEKLHLTD